jgi:hypothetical protein
MTKHKIYTERVNGGVIAECRDESCSWDGKHTFMSRDRITNIYSPSSSAVFPNRDLAVAAFRAFHADSLVGA